MFVAAKYLSLKPPLFMRFMLAKTPLTSVTANTTKANNSEEMITVITKRGIRTRSLVSDNLRASRSKIIQLLRLLG